MGSILLLPTTVLSQADPTADETIWGDETASVGGDNGAASSLLDILQRGQVGPSQSRADFLKSQDANLDNAAAAFRRRQLEAYEAPTVPGSQPRELPTGELPTLETPEEDLQSQSLKSNPRPALW